MNLSHAYLIQNGPKQADCFSLFLFNFILEYTIRNIYISI
jgi:hypothetical protein